MENKIRTHPGVSLLISVTEWVPSTSTPAGFLSRNCDQCSPYEELQHHLACYLKKKGSDNSYCCCWYCYCKRNMVEHGRGAEDIQQGRTAAQMGHRNLKRHWKGLSWGWLRKLLKWDVLHLHSLYFWRNVSHIFIYFNIPTCDAMILTIISRAKPSNFRVILV